MGKGEGSPGRTFPPNTLPWLPCASPGSLCKRFQARAPYGSTPNACSPVNGTFHVEGFGHSLGSRSIAIMEGCAERKLRLGDAERNLVRLKGEMRALVKSHDKYSPNANRLFETNDVCMCVYIYGFE